MDNGVLPIDYLLDQFRVPNVAANKPKIWEKSVRQYTLTAEIQSVQHRHLMSGFQQNESRY